MTALKNFLYLPVFLLLLAVCSGCASDPDLLLNSDLSIEELESRMAQRSDPAGNYRKSKAFLFRQVVKTPQFLAPDLEDMMETRMLIPDKFRITTLKDNAPVQIICSNGNTGWMADVSSKKLYHLSGHQLQQLLTLAKLGTPAGEYRKIFQDVKIFRCKNDDGNFYLLDCKGINGNTFRIYIDAVTFLPARMNGKIQAGHSTLNYDSKVKTYGNYNGVIIPKVTETIQNGQKQIIEIINYELNPELTDKDFLPPVF